MSSAASRLDRLVTLLDKGSTQLIRNTAATQLADIQKQNPDNLFALLGRILPFLQSKSWDTRTAAAKAIGGIVSNAPPFDPNAEDAGTEAEEGRVKSEEATPINDDLLKLETLDIKLILQHGKQLLGSAGKEYEYSMAGMTPNERLAHQKQNLTKRLGLGGEYTEDDLLTEHDFAVSSQKKIPGLSRLDTNSKVNHDSFAPKSPFSAMSPPDSASLAEEAGLSKRQLNQLKRKNKSAAKAGVSKMRVVDLSGRKASEHASTLVPPTPHGVKLEAKENDAADAKNGYFSIKRETSDDETQLVKEFKGEDTPEKPLIQPDEEHASEWPFEVMTDLLALDLFDPYWEVRHGAAMGLREVVRSHGRGAGRRFGRSRHDNNNANNAYLNDLACRLLCVLMLDRFGDYVSDTVVAPIRESIGQTLGALLTQLSDNTAILVYHMLQKMISQTDIGLELPVWQVCHGGMIGLRYFVAVRRDLLLQTVTLVDGVVAAVIKGLAHHDDDVKSVSAATLIPIARELTQTRPQALGSLISVVWDCLLDMQDDLSASTGAIMDLLATLCSFPEVLEAMELNASSDPEQSIETLVPRLYYFLRHTITSVRLAVLKALMTFLGLKDATVKAWVDGRTLRLVYQNILLERNEAVLKMSYDVWTALIKFIVEDGYENYDAKIRSNIPAMMIAVTQPVGQPRNPIPLHPTLFIKPSGVTMEPSLLSPHRNGTRFNGDGPAKKRRKIEESDTPKDSAHNTDGHMMQGDVDLVTIEVMIRTRIYASRALGLLLAEQQEDRAASHRSHLLDLLQSPHSSTRLFASMVLEEFAKHDKFVLIHSSETAPRLQAAIDAIDNQGWYHDIASSLQAARGQCQTLLSAFANNAHIPRSKMPSIAVVCQGEDGAGPTAFSLHDAERIVSSEFDRILKLLTPAQRVSGVQYLTDARRTATTAVEEARKVKANRDLAIRAGISSVLVAVHEIPKKPGTLIKALTDSVKMEELEDLQARSASATAALIDFYVSSPKKGPLNKLVSNLVKFCCVDTSETPDYGSTAQLTDAVLSLRKEEDRKDHADAVKFEEEARAARIVRRGAKAALTYIVEGYGPLLPEKLPILLDLMQDPMQSLLSEDKASSNVVDEERGQDLVDALSTLRSLVAALHPDLHVWVSTLLPVIVRGLRHPQSVIRYMAGKCFATICSVMPTATMTILVRDVLPDISNPLELRNRQGVTECVYHLIHAMGDNILPYVIFLIVPVLGRMSDANDDVRLLATTSFATLVKLVPLEAGISEPPGMPPELLAGREKERKFMAQMLDPKKVEAFTIPVAIKAELRPYQQDGVNWLAFLNRYNLHGVLCDDMGLGKTLQTLCMVASDHHIRAEEYAKTQAPDQRPLPTLIVCPPTLSGHWQQEIKQFAPFLKCVAYVGAPAERNSRRSLLSTADVVITSYDVCRNDNDVLTPITWNYCVLDEGHLIKNPKAKITQAVKKINSNHRLILSGTPIQNNVLELWSLFDFLMPGFLGTEKVFQDRFARPIAASRNAKSSSKEQEAGALAIEALHKQVLPFLLRRLKEEVLNDLPPKILQNYYCDLSDLQKRIFEDFFKKEKRTVEASVGSGDKESKQHIFQALQYMRKLCNSPAFVVKEGTPQYQTLQKQLTASNSSLRDIAHAPKLSALKDLLVDCGIGTVPEGNDMSASSYVSPHRALIFCQMKEMLDMVQTEVLGKLLPSVQYLRLDGSVEATKRQNIVNQFNNDPSYDCLLLTTSVGGLGLNLTGADTVIFVEHDWNPQKDIQAMDRAHRIGQKKVVNVYRLITRGTLEEKILSLQRFKIDVASTVVNQQNAGLGTMETDQILDLFNLGETTDAPSEPTVNGREEDMLDEEGNVKKKGEKGWLEDVGELWDERQYEEEFNLDSFVQNLQKK